MPHRLVDVIKSNLNGLSKGIKLVAESKEKGFWKLQDEHIDPKGQSAPLVDDDEMFCLWNVHVLNTLRSFIMCHKSITAIC
jgi:hypothetical protein